MMPLLYISWSLSHPIPDHKTLQSLWYKVVPVVKCWSTKSTNCIDKLVPTQQNSPTWVLKRKASTAIKNGGNKSSDDESIHGPH